MEYLTIVVHRQVVDLAVDDYGKVTILNQYPMTPKDEEDAARAGHTFKGVTQLGA